MAGADGDGQRIHAGTGNEFLHLGRVGELGVRLRNVDGVFNAGQLAKLALYHHTALVRIFHHLAGDGDVVLKAELGAVDHHGGESAVNAVLADLKAVAMVQMQRNGNGGIGYGRLHQLDQINVLGIFAGAGRNLQNDGSLFQLGSFGNSLHDLHIVDVESAYGVAALIGFLEHIFRGNQWHIEFPPL